MPTNPGRGQIGGRVILAETDNREVPKLAIRVVDQAGETLDRAAVADDGSFTVKAAMLGKARRVMLGPADGEADDEAMITYRPATFERLLATGNLELGPNQWARFFKVRRCIDATIKKCRLTLPYIDDLIGQTGSRNTIGTIGQPGASAFADLIGARIDRLAIPRFRCTPICDGVVEVYRRTCCCRPPIIIPPYLVAEAPQMNNPPRWPTPRLTPPSERAPTPRPLPLPGPDPDPGSFELEAKVLTGSTIDQSKVNADIDRRALETLGGAQLQEYLTARPYLWCRCGDGVKVGQGFVGEDGDIRVCWSEQLRLLTANCRDEFAFVVTQNINGNTVTIYDGVAAGQWFAADDDINLITFNRSAIGCAGSSFPGNTEGAFVVLQDIGDTHSHLLHTPLPDSADSVATPVANSGELSVGGVDHALGHVLQLRYHFSQPMQAVGARYYRVQVAPADANGDPTDGWSTVPAPAWRTWRSTDSGIKAGANALGPVTVGAESNLHHIPFETGGLLSDNEEWQDGQYHAVLDTRELANDRHLLRIEVFDASGNRLEPATNGFTFERWVNPSDTVPVTFGALTHMIRVENRAVVGDIVDVTGSGAGVGDCKFFVGGSDDQVSINIDAYHPAAGANYLRSWYLSVRRGINGGVAAAPASGSVEVGQFGDHLESFSFGDLLDGEDKCAFTANLHVSARIHNGKRPLTEYNRHDQASFAVEISS